jgi:hypothetical protein
MKSKWLGLYSYCTLPECPAYGLLQEPLEKVVALNQCINCRQGKEFTELFEIEINEGSFLICNSCLHSEVDNIKAKKNTKKL